MEYTIPDAVRAQMRALAASSGLPYATIVGQKVNDLQGLVDVLAEELAAAQQAADARKAGELSVTLARRRAELAAYQAEQQAASTGG
jgi:hypothetical protein